MTKRLFIALTIAFALLQASCEQKPLYPKKPSSTKSTTKRTVSPTRTSSASNQKSKNKPSDVGVSDAADYLTA